MFTTIKSLAFVLSAPIFISYCFQMNVIPSKEIARKPAVVKEVKKAKVFSTRDNVRSIVLALHTK